MQQSECKGGGHIVCCVYADEVNDTQTRIMAEQASVDAAQFNLPICGVLSTLH
jgi:hypothetical protein